MNQTQDGHPPWTPLVAVATPDQQPSETHIDGYDILGDEHYAVAVRKKSNFTVSTSDEGPQQMLMSDCEPVNAFAEMVDYITDL